MTIDNEKLDKTLGQLKDSIYEFVGEADYGDLGNLESYWQSIIDCLSEHFDFLNDNEELSNKKSITLTEALKYLPKQHYRKALSKLIKTTGMIEQSVYNGGSTGYLKEDDLSVIQDNIFDFEALFEDVLRVKP